MQKKGRERRTTRVRHRIGFPTRVPGIPETRVTRRFSSGLLPGFSAALPGYTRNFENTNTDNQSTGIDYFS